MFGRWVVAAATLAGLAACSAGSDSAKESKDPVKGPVTEVPAPTGDPTDPAAIAQRLSEKPWEIISNKGETYVPNVFYADAAENEQIMPYALDGHVQIDRLIYPTLGNPNLYTKSDINDEFEMVLRIEDSALTFLKPTYTPVTGSQLQQVNIANDANTGFGFFLVSRTARDQNTAATTAISSGDGTGVYRVYPNDIYLSPEPADEPATLKKRHTLRFVFKQGAMHNVPAGLYDVRMELKQNNVLQQTPTGAPFYEYQYNGVGVYDSEPDEHSVVNITDTQVSVGEEYGTKTKDRLDQLVQFLNTTNDPAVRNASFITFNGDLHNGGSPGSLLQRTVATTYVQEATAIVNLLKYLPMPIFLTIGNHDGYVATGQVPDAVKIADDVIFDSLEKVISDSQPNVAWDQFQQSDYDQYLARTAAENKYGGEHKDLFTGGFARTAKIDGFAGWKEIPKADRNFILYDGFYQWQKTYGPTYYSHKFGKSMYVSLNSYELRQHRRSGWGMYTVNYGGGMSEVQMDWLDRELLQGTQDGSDIVVLAHHDARGGHKGEDFGYYFDLIDYDSIYTSAVNYLVGDVFNPIICSLPDWASRQVVSVTDCTHDGLQEWMRPDAEFDCDWDQRNPDFTCDTTKGPAWSSAVEMLKALSSHPQVRTVLLGHTHYNSYEVLQQGDEMVPASMPVDATSAQKFASLEVINPIRGYAEANASSDQYNGGTVSLDPLTASYTAFAGQYQDTVAGWDRKIVAGTQGPRELMVLRLVSAADLANETYSGGSKSAMGFSVLSLSKKTDARGVTYPQINHAKFFANDNNDSFVVVGETDFDRTQSITPHDAKNPLTGLFQW